MKKTEEEEANEREGEREREKGVWKGVMGRVKEKGTEIEGEGGMERSGDRL